MYTWQDTRHKQQWQKERSKKKPPLEAWKIYCSLYNNVYLPKGRLYSLMAVHSTTLKSAFIASKSCNLLVLYVTHCSVSTVGQILHTTNRPFSLMQNLPHTYIKYICSWLYFFCIKFTRRKHKTDVPNNWWHISEWRHLVIWVKNRSFGENLVSIRPM